MIKDKNKRSEETINMQTVKKAQQEDKEGGIIKVKLGNQIRQTMLRNKLC